MVWTKHWANRTLAGHPLAFSLTLLVSSVIAVLGLLNVANQEILAGATLAVLNVVATGSRRGQAEIAALRATVAELAVLTRQQFDGVVSVDRVLTVSTSGLDVELRDATDIRMIGVTLCRTVRNHMDVLEQRLAQGATVRVAVIEPSGGPIAEAARRCAGTGSPAIFTNRLRPTLDLLRGLAAAGHPGRLDVRLLEFVPAFGMILVDPAASHGRIDIDIYSHPPTRREPVMSLLAGRDQYWYHHFLNEFDRIWATGRTLEP
jgi:hypothetical protein